jgi:hypothetical protein
MSEHGNVEEIRDHGNNCGCQEIGFAEPALLVGTDSSWRHGSVWVNPPPNLHA